MSKETAYLQIRKYENRLMVDSLKPRILVRYALIREIERLKSLGYEKIDIMKIMRISSALYDGLSKELLLIYEESK